MPELKFAKNIEEKTIGQRKKKYFSKYRRSVLALPNLFEEQIKSFNAFIQSGLKEVFEEFKEINDYSGKKFTLQYGELVFDKPKMSSWEARKSKLSYEAPLKVRTKLINKTFGTDKEQDIFLVDFPIMTQHGTFIINGVERVIVPQLARSYGVIFTKKIVKDRALFGSKIIPIRGAWIEFETDADDVIYIRIDRNRKFPVTTFLRTLGVSDDKAILALFKGDKKTTEAIKKTLEKDSIKEVDEAFVDIYKRLRDGDLATLENAREFIDSILSEERYDLSEVGRFKFNNRFELPVTKKALQKKVIDLDDITRIISHIIELNHTTDAVEDDIDHLGSRRVRFVGELLQQKVRTGLAQMRRNIQNRMSTIDTTTSLPTNFITPRPLQARVKEFFTTNQLSQLMLQENILTEIEHLRTVSAMGPGGITRERAGLEVRDVHPSHYGRLCPIHTPEGPNIGLILRFSSYSRINTYGMIETPYLKVEKGKISGQITYMNAHEEEKYKIAQASSVIDDNNNLSEKYVTVRYHGTPNIIKSKEVDFIDIAANQAFSIATSMIPFLDHNDANRALMATNMQKQAVPLLQAEAPIVATGAEESALKFSNRLFRAKADGVVKFVDGEKIVIDLGRNKKEEYVLENLRRTNNFTSFSHRPVVNVGDKVKKGDLLADISTSDNGQIAIGKNLLVGFMSWYGSNYEDAIIISERLVKDDTLTSIHLKEIVINVRDTRLGPEVTTSDIPNVGDLKLRNLDEEGIIRIGAEVRPGDILVGKITPKGETQLTPEERLLRSIFGEKSRDIKDSSKRADGGLRGRVVGIRIFSRKNGDKLDSGIIKRIHVEIAQLRPVGIGDKLAGRHGNKGVISKVLPVEDMPYTKNGTPVDIILTPLGVPSRMNLGQILELHLGLAANALDYQAICPAFQGANVDEIRKELVTAGFNSNGKIPLYDGRTGEKFASDIAVGYMYMLKLHHMVEDKISMRSIGPYSLITQQPLGGKAQNGGQRFGEMEVWALLGHGAAHTLREILTYKSDDIVGRSSAFDSIVKGYPIDVANIPASFNVLVKYMRGLGLDINVNESDVKR